MKKSVKGVLASIGISTLILGGSLPLMGTEQAETAPVKDGMTGKKCAGMKKVLPVVKDGTLIKSAAELKDLPAGRKCGGLKPVTLKDGTVVKSAAELKDLPAGRRCGGIKPAVEVKAPAEAAK
ncbi:MAG: hypothetical protein HGA97_03610 [Chlorobiaceae bacterium]|nr:hypothetical protein [Chlorobiaceae bacterium]